MTLRTTRGTRKRLENRQPAATRGKNGSKRGHRGTSGEDRQGGWAEHGREPTPR